jgi:alpha-beta hydrolase superfamily lysophospholipase
LCHLHDHIVDSAQPLFLIVVSAGALIMTLAIVPLAFEETVTTSEQLLNAACMAVPWLYFIGTSIALSALLAKMNAVYKVRAATASTYRLEHMGSLIRSLYTYCGSLCSLGL